MIPYKDNQQNVLMSSKLCSYLNAVLEKMITI